MGWAGNPEPTYDIPTVIADHVEKVNFIFFIIFYKLPRNQLYKSLK